MPIRQPLADQMRPHTLDQLVGQRHLLAPGKPLYQIITRHIPMSLILWGPPGCGKSSLAFVMSKTLNVPFETFNASIENKATLMRLVSRHPDETFVLLLDEIHRLTKPIQDYLLPYLEDGHILLVGTTTENPIMAIVPAIRSRCQVFEFERLSSEDIQPVLQRAARQFLGFDLPDEQAHAIADCGNGDARVALNVLDTLHAMHPDGLDMDAIRAFAFQQHFAMDKDATQHYDYLSAFQDSIEGSDTDAALYYLAVILRAGDLESVVRRLKDSAALEIGLPRASTHVAMATILLALAPKSDSVLQAYKRAEKDAEHPAQHPMPHYLRDTHYKHARELRGAGDMLNMYDEPHQVAQQAYMPDDLIGHHYLVPRDNRLDHEYYERYMKLFEYIYRRPFVAGDQSTVFDHNFKKK